MADTIGAGKLAQDLENVTESSLRWIGEVLARGVDEENSALLRAQSAAANIAINAQLRADALRLRAQRGDKALETLMKLISEKERVIPADLGPFEGESCSHP